MMRALWFLATSFVIWQLAAVSVIDSRGPQKADSEDNDVITSPNVQETEESPPSEGKKHGSAQKLNKHGGSRAKSEGAHRMSMASVGGKNKKRTSVEEVADVPEEQKNDFREEERRLQKEEAAEDALPEESEPHKKKQSSPEESRAEEDSSIVPANVVEIGAMGTVNAEGLAYSGAGEIEGRRQPALQPTMRREETVQNMKRSADEEVVSLAADSHEQKSEDLSQDGKGQNKARVQVSQSNPSYLMQHEHRYHPHGSSYWERMTNFTRSNGLTMALCLLFFAIGASGTVFSLYVVRGKAEATKVPPRPMASPAASLAMSRPSAGPARLPASAPLANHRKSAGQQRPLGR